MVDRRHDRNKLLYWKKSVCEADMLDNEKDGMKEDLRTRKSFPYRR